MMKKRKTVKKIGDVWVTPETLEKTFPKSCVVSCKVLEMTVKDDFPILLRKKSSVHYEVFGKEREDYESVLIKIKGENNNEYSEK